jgi:hypothetical protein
VAAGAASTDYILSQEIQHRSRGQENSAMFLYARSMAAVLAGIAIAAAFVLVDLVR